MAAIAEGRADCPSLLGFVCGCVRGKVLLVRHRGGEWRAAARHVYDATIPGPSQSADLFYMPDSCTCKVEPNNFYMPLEKV